MTSKNLYPPSRIFVGRAGELGAKLSKTLNVLANSLLSNTHFICWSNRYLSTVIVWA
jgi:hypothetical protein